MGHNVLMTDYTVGDASLIEMVAVVALGTVVEEDVLLVLRRAMLALTHF